MSTIELKNEFHNLIDSIKDKAILEKFYYLMENASRSSSAKSLWAGLSESEREELLLSDDESKNKDNLISHDEMKKRHNRWL